MMRDFLEDVAVWVINRANFHINKSDVGELVKLEIRNGWEYNFTNEGVLIRNSTDKAVFVEFGVGVVGQAKAHPNASAQSYEYNVDSGKKSTDGSWTFFTNEQELDLPQSALEEKYTYKNPRGKKGEGGNRLLVRTHGTQGVWYAYNAIVDAKVELSKANGGEIGALWEKVKSRYIK